MNNENKLQKCFDRIDKYIKKIKKLDLTIDTVGITIEQYRKTDENIMLEKFNGDTHKLFDYYWNTLRVKEHYEESIQTNQHKVNDIQKIVNNLNTKIYSKECIELKYNNIPQIIKDFIEQWKVNAIKWYIEHHDNSKRDFFAHRTVEDIERWVDYDAQMKAVEIANRVFDKCGNIVDASRLTWGRKWNY